MTPQCALFFDDGTPRSVAYYFFDIITPQSILGYSTYTMATGQRQKIRAIYSYFLH